MPLAKAWEQVIGHFKIKVKQAPENILVPC